MNVLLKTDGRLFEETGDDPKIDYQPGDVAWFEEDILLVVAIRDGQAEAIEHPAAREMMRAALYSHGGAADRAAAGLREAMAIHARAGWRKALAVCSHPEDDVVPLSGDGWMCMACGKDVPPPPPMQSPITDAAIDAAVAEAK